MMKSEPASVVRRRISSINSLWPGIKPMLPATASTMTQAISAPCSSKQVRKASRTLYGRAMVSRATSGITPAESAMPKLATPDPA